MPTRPWEECGNQGMTDAQRRMLNAVCGDLAKHLHWHGAKLSKDSWRHFLSAVSAGQTMHRGWDYGEGHPHGFIVLGKSSLELTRAEAKDAITMGIHLGDDPSSQSMDAAPVKWSDAVLHGLGYSSEDLK